MFRSVKDLERFEEAVRRAEPQDPVLFRSLFSQGVDLLGLQLKDVGEAFSMSPASVTRWRQGRNAPHPAFRRVVYRWLATRALHLRKRLEQSEHRAGQRVAVG